MIARRLRAEPEVYTLDGLVSEEERQDLLRIAGETWRGEAEGGEVHVNETGLCFELPIEGEPLLEALRGRLERLMGYESGLGYTFRVRRYGPGNGHPPHLDCYGAEGFELLATSMLVLSAPESGGHTGFPRAAPEPCSVPPVAGRALVWFNHLPDGRPDPASLHVGEEVKAGEKVVLLYFFYAPAPIAAVRQLAASAGESG